MIPTLPFPGYKWRWASFQPTEGLNDPSVFLGVLRTLNDFEGCAPSDPRLIQALAVVKRQTRTRVDLARTPERNLIRNSGQYWKGTGLLEEVPGKIVLSDFGKNVANGKITKVDFAITVIKTFTLPNNRIFSPAEIREWESAGLRITPLELILEVISKLFDSYGPENGYISSKELISIVIPLAGNNVVLDEHVQSIIAFRKNQLNLSNWPNCAPAANDERMANEYLLFLYHYGFLEIVLGRSRNENRYYIVQTASQEIQQIPAIPSAGASLVQVAQNARNYELPNAIELALVDRERKFISRLSRSGQSKYRREVLRAFGGTCILTGEKIQEVLEAPHIIPASKRGPDVVQNGLCMRADVHILFDNGHIRIDELGDVSYSDVIAGSVTYASLPTSIVVPTFIDKEALKWRLKYV